MAERNKLSWFPIDPVQLLTERRFSALDDATFGRAMRDAFYLWLYGAYPGDESAESERLRQIVQPWIQSVRDAQEKRFERASERNKKNIAHRWNKDLDTIRIRPDTAAYRIQENRIEENRIKTTTTTKPPKGAVSFPDWWNDDLNEAWIDFAAFRGKKFRGSYVMAKLARLRASGHEPLKVLRQSLENGWQGLFEIREGINGRQSEYDRATAFFTDQLAAESGGTRKLPRPGSEAPDESEPDIPF